jgi:peptidoglycan hydrolase CwlO-like protein
MQYDVAALLGVISLAKNVKSHEERIAELEREIEMLNQELETLKN